MIGITLLFSIGAYYIKDSLRLPCLFHFHIRSGRNSPPSLLMIGNN